MNTYTSVDLEAFEETYELESITEECVFRYQLTEGEMGWLEWIGERYAIASLLWSTLDDKNTVLIDVMDVSEALAADGVDRAPCLSEDTQLQRLIWFIGPEEDRS